MLSLVGKLVRLIATNKEKLMIFAQAQFEGAVSQLAAEIKNTDSAKWYRRLKIIQLSISQWLENRCLN
jgi:hypothetical protein